MEKREKMVLRIYELILVIVFGMKWMDLGWIWDGCQTSLGNAPIALISAMIVDNKLKIGEEKERGE